MRSGRASNRFLCSFLKQKDILGLHVSEVQPFGALWSHLKMRFSFLMREFHKLKNEQLAASDAYRTDNHAGKQAGMEITRGVCVGA